MESTCASTTVRTTIKARPGLLAVNMTVNVSMLALECGAVNLSVQFTRISHPFVAWKLHLENVARNQSVPSVINMEPSPELEQFPEMEQPPPHLLHLPHVLIKSTTVTNISLQPVQTKCTETGLLSTVQNSVDSALY